MFVNSYTNKMIDFIRDIGIEVHKQVVEEETNIPGIKIEYGKLIVDEEKLKYPGDLLHEAGHLAVKLPSKRNTFYINAGNDPAEEMMAISWSYAAAIKIGIPPEIVFHPDGYKGGSQNILDNFKLGNFLALPMLQWIGLCYDQKHAQQAGEAPYPNMIKWLREE